MRGNRPQFHYLFFITAVLISSCAGSPPPDTSGPPETPPVEQVPEETTDPETGAAAVNEEQTVEWVVDTEEGEWQDSAESDDIPPDSAMAASSKKTGKDSVKKAKPAVSAEKKVSRPEDSENPVPAGSDKDAPEQPEEQPTEPADSGEPETAIPAADTEQAEEAVESEQIGPAGLPDETVESAGADEAYETGGTGEAEGNSGVSGDSPAETVAAAETGEAPVNPLLAEDIPYEAGKSDPVTDPEISIELIEPEEESADAAAVDRPSAETGDPGTSDFTESAIPSAEDDFITPEEQAGEPSRWLDSPGEFSVLLEGQGWVFRSDLSTPGSWRFLSREIEEGVTRFTFRFEEPGKWKLVFERQDLSSGGSERVTRNVSVGESDGPVVENGPETTTGGASIPGDMPDDPEERDSAALAALESGRSGEAISYWEKDASLENDAGREARKAIIREAVRTGATAPLVTWLPRYIEDGADRDILAGALDVLDAGMGYDESVELIIDELVRDNNDPRQPEWLYRLARRLEKPGEGRDLDRAAVLYSRVIEGWPYSEWRDLSEERLTWLRRHYFRVQ